MEFFLWLWTFDRRWLVGIRPIFRNFALLYIIPIVLNCSMIGFTLFWLYPFSKKDFSRWDFMMLLKTLICIISTVNCIIIMRDIIKFFKHQIESLNNLIYSQIINNKSQNQEQNQRTIINDNNLSIFTSTEEFWVSRDTLCSVNGFAFLVISLLQIAWSLVYLIKRDNFKDHSYKNFKQGMEIFIMINVYLEIIPFAYIVLLSIYMIAHKFTFAISSMVCSSCVLCCHNCCRKKESKQIPYRLDFSDSPKIEVIEEIVYK